MDHADGRGMDRLNRGVGVDVWPEHSSLGAVRFARPTARFDDVVEFYRDDLGLEVLAQWRDHDGYDGAVFGLPGAGVQLEITQHGVPPVIPAAHPENQVVLYLRGEQVLRGVVDRLTSRGHRPVEPANPYWAREGAVLFADPDGWVVVLVPWVFGERSAG